MIPHSPLHGDGEAQTTGTTARAKEQRATSDFMFPPKYFFCELHLTGG
jgi:hypothetical protein